MPVNPRVKKAFRAMKSIGISEEKVKPILKSLLKLYDKNWELIEEENYRALADAIFEKEEVEVQPIYLYFFAFLSFTFLVKSELCFSSFLSKAFKCAQWSLNSLD